MRIKCKNNCETFFGYRGEISLTFDEDGTMGETTFNCLLNNNVIETLLAEIFCSECGERPTVEGLDPY
jgi:hypothetical protein